MSHELLWVVVVVVAIAVLLLVALAAILRGRVRPFETRLFPAGYVEPYEHRIDEVERMFVSQPRDAVAAAKLLVDDMFTRMGYPVRITNEERARDLRHYSRTHADRYRLATGLKAAPTTEDLRRALHAYLDTARELVAEARKTSERAERKEARRPEVAG
jgi:hypothetical protein